MYLKYSLFYYCLAFVLVLIGQMYHPVFYLFLMGYGYFIIKRFGYCQLFAMIIITVLCLQIMQYPSTCLDTQVEGVVQLAKKDSILVKTTSGKVKVYGTFDEVHEGDRITVVVSYFDFALPRNDHAFDYQRYMYSLGIMSQATCTKIVSHTASDSIFTNIKKRITSDDLTGSFANLFILGVKDEQMESYYQNLTNLSIVHLFALSGMHIHILKKWFQNILKYFISPKKVEYLSVLLIGLYLSWIPYNISFMRAYIVMVCLTLFKKHLHALDALSIAAMITLLMNPYSIYHLSFIFSYFIYFLVILVGKRKYATFFIYLASIPIIITIQYQINLISLFLGIVLLPLVSLLYQLLLWYVVFGGILKPILDMLLYLLDQMIVFSTALSVYVPFSIPPLFFILCYYFYYFKMLLQASIKQSYHQEFLKIVCLLVMFYFYPQYSMVSKVVMIDVGQGDCFLIKQAYQKGNILIDTGGLKNKDVASEIIVPYLHSEGIFHLDYVILSHDDFDHSGGYESLAKQMPIDHTITETFDTMRIGEATISLLTSEYPSKDTNDASLVCKVEYRGLRYLFTGDASYHVEKSLIEKYGKMDIDILKVSHHGSNTATSEAFLQMINPKVALISCGQNNRYGHPHLEVIERLKSHGVHIYRSDQKGMVSIVSYGGNNYIYQ